MTTLVSGSNAPLGAKLIEVRLVNGGDSFVEHGVAVIPQSGPDRVWLPLHEDTPAYSPQGNNAAHFWLDLDRLHPTTDRLLLVVYTGKDTSTLSPLRWVQAQVGAFSIDLSPDELAMSCITFAELYRRNGEWKLRARNDGVFNGIEELGRRLGIAIEDKNKRHNLDTRPSPDGADAPREDRGAQWGGSAFVVADGHLITNAHVVSGANGVIVAAFGGRHEAEPVIIDHTNDLALIRIRHIDRHAPLSFRVSPGPVLGEPATSIGYPLSSLLGSGAKLGEGIVSGLLGPNDDIRAFQVTSPIQPGSSGGPVLDQYGLVIGVVTSTFMGAQNVNLAIRGALAASLIESAGVPVRYAPESNPAMSLAQIGRDRVPLVWRLECHR